MKYTSVPIFSIGCLSRKSSHEVKVRQAKIAVYTIFFISRINLEGNAQTDAVRAHNGITVAVARTVGASGIGEVGVAGIDILRVEVLGVFLQRGDREEVLAGEIDAQILNAGLAQQLLGEGVVDGQVLQTDVTGLLEITGIRLRKNTFGG